MSSEQALDVSCWYAIHTNPKQERRATDNLRAWGVETLSPQIRVPRLNQFTGATTDVISPLYPSYIFAYFNAAWSLHKIQFTRGVNSVVSFNSIPTPVDDRIIDIIKAQMDDEGFVQIGEELRYGDKVIVKQGPFRSLVGTFESKLDGSERVKLLLTTINYQGHMLIDRRLVKKIPEFHDETL